MGVPINVTKLKNLYTEKGWTQDNLAKWSDCSPRTVVRIMSKGRAALSVLRRIAGALSVPLKDLLLNQMRCYPLEYSQQRLSVGTSNVPRQWLYSDQQQVDRPEMYYGNTFQIKSNADKCAIPYVRLEGSRDHGACEYPSNLVKVAFAKSPFIFSTDLDALPCIDISHDGDKVRLAEYDIRQTGDPNGRKALHVWFSPSPVKYSQCCKVAKNIDKQWPTKNSPSCRSQFAPPHAINRTCFLPELPNVCGVGLFLIAKGKNGKPQQVIITHQSPTQAFSAGQWAYSASGSMDWNPKRPQTPQPFADIERESLQEINHRTDAGNLRLIEFGLDATELYVQFSFVEEANHSADDIIYEAHDAEDHYEWDDIKAIDFTPEAVVDALFTGDWEPAAAAALITLCSKKFGRTLVDKLLIDRYAHLKCNT